jgi:hypothetical protein
VPFVEAVTVAVVQGDGVAMPEEAVTPKLAGCHRTANCVRHAHSTALRHHLAIDGRGHAMSVGRLFAVALIFILATAGWFVLAGSVQIRSDSSDQRLGDAVSGLWGSPQRQDAPQFHLADGAGMSRLGIEGSDISADFRLNQRRKGLLWYATYVVGFKAAYRVANPLSRPASATMTFAFPDSSGSYDGFAVRVNGAEVPVRYGDGKALATFSLPARGTATVSTGYRTNGMDSWEYAPSPGGVGVVRDFRLNMTTDFERIDYPNDGVSPTHSERAGQGWKLAWTYDSIVSGHPIGMLMPKPLNPGPLVTRITAFAPVSLLFFFVALILLTATSGVRLHPMHYGFIAAGFFAFHLLLAYLADQIDINLAFAVAAATSVALVVGYLRVVVGKSRALAEIAASQFLFLVLFSYSFFFEGITGLAVTIGAVLTLAFFMAKTAHVEWDEVFAKRGARPPAQGLAAPVPIAEAEPTAARGDAQ